MKSDDYPITSAEASILYLAALGFNTSRTADIIGIGCQTVKNQRTALYKRLGLKSITQAVILCYEAGWLDSPGFRDYANLSRTKVDLEKVEYEDSLKSALENLL